MGYIDEIILPDAPYGYWTFDAYEAPTNTTSANALVVKKPSSADYVQNFAIYSDWPVTQPNDRQWAWFKITPAITGSFTMYELGVGDSYGYLYQGDPNAGGTQIASNDDSGPNSGFQIVQTLTGGVTYWLGVRPYSANDYNWTPLTLVIQGGPTTGGVDGTFGYRDYGSGGHWAMPKITVPGTLITGKVGQALQGGTGSPMGLGFSSTFGTDLTAITVEAWVRISSNVTTSVFAAADPNDQYEFSSWNLDIAAGKFRFYVSAGGAKTTVQSPLTYGDNAWHHVAGTYDGTTVTLYVDGTSVATGARTGTVNWADSGLIMLRTKHDGTYAPPVSTADVDSLGFYKTALSAGRINAHSVTMQATDLYGKAVIADSPTEWWRLNETSGTSISNAAASTPGTVVGSPDLGVPGVVRSAVKFKGTSTDYISTPIGPWGAATTQTRRSMECWFRLATERSAEHLLMGGDAGSSSIIGMRVLTSGRIRVNWNTGLTTNVEVETVGTWDDDKWHHIVAVFDGPNNIQRLYVDGAEQITGALPAGSALYSTSDWRLGQSPSFAIGSKATVDEVAIYDGVVLSAARVAVHFGAGARAISSVRTRTLTATPTVVANRSVAFTRGRSMRAQQSQIRRSLAFTRQRQFSEVQAGETLAYPEEWIIPDSNGPYRRYIAGWTRDIDETSLGATGVGTYWMQVTAPRRTVVTITSDESVYMRAYTVVDPYSPVTVDNLALVDEGSEVSVSVLNMFYVMVDVLDDSGGYADFNFDFIPSHAFVSLYVVSDAGGSTTDAVIDVAPAAMSANVSATSDSTSIEVVFDGVTVLSAPLASDYTWKGTIPIPSRAAGTYDLVVRAFGLDTIESNVIHVRIDRQAVPVAPTPTDDPARVPGTSVGKWMFVDPATLTYYEFPMNPSRASSTNSPRNHSVESTTKPVSFVVYEGSLGAKSYTFGGVILDQPMYQALAYFSLLNRRIWLVDHNLVAWQVVPQKFDVKPRTNKLNPWIQDYEFTVLLLKGPTQAVIE